MLSAVSVPSSSSSTLPFYFAGADLVPGWAIAVRRGRHHRRHPAPVPRRDRRVREHHLRRSEAPAALPHRARTSAARSLIADPPASRRASRARPPVGRLTRTHAHGARASGHRSRALVLRRATWRPQRRRLRRRCATGACWSSAAAGSIGAATTHLALAFRPASAARGGRQRELPGRARPRGCAPALPSPRHRAPLTHALDYGSPAMARFLPQMPPFDRRPQLRRGEACALGKGRVLDCCTCSTSTS